MRTKALSLVVAVVALAVWSLGPVAPPASAQLGPYVNAAGLARGAITTAVGTWDDAVISADGINPTGPADAMTPITTTTGYFGCLLAIPTGNPSASVTFQLPHAHMAGTDTHPHLHLVKNDASDNTGTAPFQAKFRVCELFSACSAWSADWITGTVVATAGGSTTPPDVADQGFLVVWDLADATFHFGPSSVILMQIQRNGGTSGNVAMCSVDLHYKRNTNGTVNETSR